MRSREQIEADIKQEQDYIDGIERCITRDQEIRERSEQRLAARRAELAALNEPQWQDGNVVTVQPAGLNRRAVAQRVDGEWHVAGFTSTAIDSWVNMRDPRLILKHW